MRTLRGVDRSLSATPPTTLGDMLPPIAYFSDITWNILEDVRGRNCSFNGFLTYLNLSTGSQNVPRRCSSAIRSNMTLISTHRKMGQASVSRKRAAMRGSTWQKWRRRGCAGTGGEGGQTGQLRRGRVEGGREGTERKSTGGTDSEMTAWACFGELRQISGSSCRR